MKNPIIIGTKSALKTKNMFDLMKDVMKQNQTICLTLNITDQNFQLSPGIFLDQPISRNLFRNDTNFKKPWIIIGKAHEIYSQINTPLYLFENGELWEQYKFKSITKRNKLATIQNNDLLWENQHDKNFLERRGNFDNITLIGMTDTWENFIVLPKEWRKIAKISTVIKDTHEVHGETKETVLEIFTLLLKKVLLSKMSKGRI